MWVWNVKYNFVNVYCENMFVENYIREQTNYYYHVVVPVQSTLPINLVQFFSCKRTTRHALLINDYYAGFLIWLSD